MIKKHITFASIFLLMSSTLVAQNLVPNPGFEQFNYLPTQTGEWCATKYWDNLNGYCENDTLNGSPDYLHQDGTFPASLPINAFSLTIPYEGNAIIGLSLWYGIDTTSYREYISTLTTYPTEIGESYTLSFYISNGLTDIRYGGYGISNFGVYFSEAKPQQVFAKPILVNPQIELNEPLYSNEWLQLSFTFTADKEYKHITFGNFRYNTDIIIEQFEPYITGGAAYYYIDEVCLIKEGDDCSISTSIFPSYPARSNISIYPNPITNNTLFVNSNQINLNNKTISIYDSLGKLIQSNTINSNSRPCEIPIEHLSKGVYIINIQTNLGIWTEKFIRQ